MSSQRLAIIREDIGGQFAADPKGFLTIVPIWWAISIIAGPALADTRTVVAANLANAVAFVFTFALLLLFRSILLSHRASSPVPVGIIILVGCALGITKACITVSVTALLMGEPDYFAQLPLRSAASAGTGAWFLIIVAIFLAAQHRYQNERDLLIASVMTRQADLGSQGALGEPDLDRDRLLALLRDTRAAVLTHGNNPESLAHELTHLLDSKLRPLTHDLWSQPVRGYTDFSFRDLIRLLLTRHQYWPVATALLHVVVTSPFVFYATGFVEGALRLTLSSLVVWAILALASMGSHSSPGRGLPRLVGAACAFAAVNESLAYVFFGPFPTAFPVTISLANTALLVCFALLMGIVRVAQSDRQKIREELKQLLGEDYFRERVVLEHARLRHRDVAELLHGRLQNRIVSVVLGLARKPRLIDTTALVKDVDEIERTVLGQNPPPLNGGDTDLHEALHALSTRWSGIVEIDSDAVTPETLTPDVVDSALRIIEEAVTNAVRHGLASHISVDARAHDGTLDVTVLDNGRGPQQGNPGLGTLLITHTSGDKWSLETGPAGRGSLFTAQIPLPGSGPL
jgi:hypothetical protein